MDFMIHSLGFALAALCAGVMGFAIQRGATCTVAAVDELVQRRGAKRLLALVEASAWVGGGLLILDRLHALPQMPAGYAPGLRTFVGAALLGLGAFVNRACVFGAIARFGSGEWAYAATPAGFYLGCLAAGAIRGPATPPGTGASIVFAAPTAVVWIVAAFFAWRIGTRLRSHRGKLRQLVSERLWSPHAATTVIGVTFLAMLVLVGAWAYTDALAELARGGTRGLGGRLLLAAFLLLGATVGGWTAGRFRPSAVAPGAVLRCVAGGALMGWGGSVMPGSNDGIILVGMPLLRPYAWLAFATMCASIAIAQGLQAHYAARTSSVPA